MDGSQSAGEAGAAGGAAAPLGLAPDGRPARVLAVFGPTAVGKTAVAVALAERLRARGLRPVAVSADALQVYRGLEVLTGAADALAAPLEHRLVGVAGITERWSVAEHARRAHTEVDALLAAGAVPLVVGGTGLYLRAALADLDLRPAPPAGLRAALEREVAEHGVAALHARLPGSVAGALAPTDRSRVVRAHELLAMGIDPAREGDNELWTTRTRHPTRLLALTMARAALATRIEARVRAMVEAGAADEVRAAHAAGASATARAALGFAELLDGDVERLAVRTRRYARRQLTWMRKLPGAELVDVTGRAPDEVASALLPGADPPAGAP